jgi:hypothetical protein
MPERCICVGCDTRFPTFENNRRNGHFGVRLVTSQLLQLENDESPSYMLGEGLSNVTMATLSHEWF